MTRLLRLTTRRLDLDAEPTYRRRDHGDRSWGFIGVVVEPALMLRRTEAGILRALSPATMALLDETDVAAAWSRVLACSADVRVFPDPSSDGLQFAFAGLESPARIQHAAAEVMRFVHTLREAIAEHHRASATRAIAYRASAVDTASAEVAIQRVDASSQRALRRHHRGQTVRFLAPLALGVGAVTALLALAGL